MQLIRFNPVAWTIAFAALVAAVACSTAARAAGTAYVVDTAEVGEVGNCKVEAWTSWARNRDGLVTSAPACVVNAVPRLEFSAEISRTRTDDEWATVLAPKAKINLVPTAIGSFGWALAAGTSYDATLRETTTLYANLPGTLRLSQTARINLNAGWLQDRLADRHFATWGLGLDWIFAPKWSTTLEAFGQLNGQHLGSETRPRFQVGIRYRPVDNFSTDLIWGRNIAGEGSDWITLSTTFRFSAL